MTPRGLHLCLCRNPSSVVYGDVHEGLCAHGQLKKCNAGVENLTAAAHKMQRRALKKQKKSMLATQAVCLVAQPVVIFLLTVRINNEIQVFGFSVGNRNVAIGTISLHSLKM